MTPESDVLVWAVIAIGALLTFGLRGSFIFLADRVEGVMSRIEPVLAYVPAAVLAALVAPAIVLVDGQVAFSPGNERLLAGAAAVVVAWVSENMLATIVAGMVVFWALRFLV